MDSMTSVMRSGEGLRKRFAALKSKLVENRMIRAGLQMTGFRVVALGVGACGSIWAARCLGPEKTGISGVILAASTQLALFTTLNQDVALIRHYKELPDASQQNGLISGVVTQRLVAGFLLTALAWVLMLALRVSPEYILPAVVGSALLFFTTNTPYWLLQAQENMPAQYRMTAIQACLSAVIIVAIFRPGMPVGSDLVVTLVVTGIISVLTWRVALAGRHTLTLSLRSARQELPLLWQGRWLFLSGLVMYLYINSEQPLLAYFGSVKQLGQYRSAVQITGAIQPFLSMLSVLLYPRYVEWNRQGPLKLWAMQKKIVKILALPLLVAGVLVLTIVPKVQPILFGEKFAAAAVPCAFLILSKLVVVVNSVFSFGLWARKRDKATLVVMAVSALFSVLSNVAFIPSYGLIAASVANFGSEAIILLGTFWYTLHLVAKEKAAEIAGSPTVDRL